MTGVQTCALPIFPLTVTGRTRFPPPSTEKALPGVKESTWYRTPAASSYTRSMNGLGTLNRVTPVRNSVLRCSVIGGSLSRLVQDEVGVHREAPLLSGRGGHERRAQQVVGHHAHNPAGAHRLRAALEGPDSVPVGHSRQLR